MRLQQITKRAVERFVVFGSLLHALNVKIVLQDVLCGKDQRVRVRVAFVTQRLPIAHTGRARPAFAVHAAAVGSAHTPHALGKGNGARRYPRKLVHGAGQRRIG